MAFILVDEILKFEAGKSIVALKNVSSLKEFFIDHVIYGPMLPPTLVAESVAQAAGWLITASYGFRKRGLLIDLGMLEFDSIVRPADQLLLEAELLSLHEEAAMLTGRAKIDGRVIGNVDSGFCVLIDADKLDDIEKTRSMFSALLKK